MGFGEPPWWSGHGYLQKSIRVAPERRVAVHSLPVGFALHEMGPVTETRATEFLVPGFMEPLQCPIDDAATIVPLWQCESLADNDDVWLLGSEQGKVAPAGVI